MTCTEISDTAKIDWAKEFDKISPSTSDLVKRLGECWGRDFIYEVETYHRIGEKIMKDGEIFYKVLTVFTTEDGIRRWIYLMLTATIRECKEILYEFREFS